MPRSPALRSLLLVLALVAGQWLAFAHGLQHSALTPDADCEQCLQLRQLGHAAPASAPPLALRPPSLEAPAAPAPLTAARRSFTAYRSRAPPLVLV